jgi:chemotaxis protein methyltransferase CheR
MSLLGSVPGTVELTTREFDSLRALIHEIAGIALAPAKRTLLESRLQRRLRALNLHSFADYIDRLAQPGTPEVVEMINCVTTNKTDFYREPHHFRFLQQQVIPTAQARNIGARRLRIWSAGCSTGEEPYTIALAVADALGPRLKSWDVRILASDIDTKVLETAAAGTYPADRIEVVPDHLRERYFSPSSSSPGAWDIDDSLRRMITFRRINFADPRWPINTQFDLIFCRNVIIYFDRDTQAVLFERFAQLLKKDGHLVIGHSETLSWLTGTFAQVRGVPTVYRLATAADGDLRPPSVVAAQAETSQPAPGADAPVAPPRPAVVAPMRPLAVGEGRCGSTPRPRCHRVGGTHAAHPHHPRGWGVRVGRAGRRAHHPRFLRCGLPLRPGNAHRRHEPLPAARGPRQGARRAREHALRRARDGSAHQRADAPRGRSPPPACQGLRRQRGDQARRAEP